MSRGACTHHFPTTQELLVASIEAMFDRLSDEFVDTFQALPGDERTLSNALGELWRIVQGPSYAADLEIVVASRTDDELADVVRRVATVMETTIADLVRRVFPHLVDHQALGTLIDVSIAVSQGALVSQIAGLGDPERVIAWARAAVADVVDAPNPPPHK